MRHPATHMCQNLTLITGFRLRNLMNRSQPFIPWNPTRLLVWFCLKTVRNPVLDSQLMLVALNLKVTTTVQLLLTGRHHGPALAEL